MSFRRLVYSLPPAREDELAAELWAIGTLGTESREEETKSSGREEEGGRLRVEAYFDGGVEIEVPFAEFLLEDGAFQGQDWLAPWREQARPFAVGARFWLDPREPEEGEGAAAPEGRILLRLPARAAFGTGSHESTSLALELLETTSIAGRRVLDVGTGTGVLAFAALRLGAREAVGFDVDPAAPFHARDNGRLNALKARLFAGRLSSLLETRSFDLALVNVVPEQIFPEMEALTALLLPGAEMILSGILRERGDGVLDRLRALGFGERARREAGDWIAFRVGS
jgi:ribosomal protein L11 methyltransferase